MNKSPMRLKSPRPPMPDFASADHGPQVRTFELPGREETPAGDQVYLLIRLEDAQEHFEVLAVLADHDQAQALREVYERLERAVPGYEIRAFPLYAGAAEALGL